MRYLHKFFRFLSLVCKKRYGLINANTLNISGKLFNILLVGKMSSSVVVFVLSAIYYFMVLSVLLS